MLRLTMRPHLCKERVFRKHTYSNAHQYNTGSPDCPLHLHGHQALILRKLLQRFGLKGELDRSYIMILGGKMRTFMESMVDIQQMLFYEEERISRCGRTYET